MAKYVSRPIVGQMQGTLNALMPSWDCDAAMSRRDHGLVKAKATSFWPVVAGAWHELVEAHVCVVKPNQATGRSEPECRGVGHVALGHKFVTLG